MENILYYIDNTYISIRNIKMEGWAISKTGKEVHYKVKRNSNIKKVERIDVQKCYPFIKDNTKCGFELNTRSWKKETVTIIDGENELKFDIDCFKYKKQYIVASIKKIINKIKCEGIFGALKAIKNKICHKETQITKKEIYSDWRLSKIVTKEEIERQKAFVFAFQPLISIVVPTFNTPINYLKEMIDSVLFQSYKNWELCIADGGSSNAQTIKMLHDYANTYPNIKVEFMNENKMISNNTNEALKNAKGDFIGLFDHDDLLEPNALYECVKLLNEKNNLDVIYSDEDKVDSKGIKFFEPHFKPDFSKYTLRSYNYITHFTIIRKTILDKVGKFDEQCDGAQDFDMFLRICDITKNIGHIPKVLYHWRVHNQSTSGSASAKSYVLDAGKTALRKHLKRNHIQASVCDGIFPTSYKINYEIKGSPLISIIIPNKDHIRDLKQCLSSIKNKTTYSNYEIVIIENNSELPETFAYYKTLEALSNIRILTWEDKFNYSAINNFGVKHVNGDFILLLNNDVEIINESWLTEMLMLAQQEEVGAVGAKLYYEDDTIQHAGVIIGIGSVAGHSHKYYPRQSYGYVGRLSVVQNVSAVTAACLLIEKRKFLEVGGLDEAFEVAFNDVDFCLKVLNKGYQNLFTPYAELYHYESKSRGLEDTEEKVKRFNSEIKRFEDKWGLWREDPYYNVNLSIVKEDFSLKN